MDLIHIAEDTWVEKKQSRAEDLCCLLLANEFDYATLLWNQEEEWKKECIANKQDLWRLQHAMRFIKAEHKQENPTTVVPKPGPSKGKEKVRGQVKGRGRGRGRGRGKGKGRGKSTK